MSIAFTGFSSISQAIQGYDTDASWCCPELTGNTILSLGGGNAAGRFTPQVVEDITKYIGDVKAAGYAGVAYDIELVYANASVMAPLFAKSFKAAKEAGLIVVVTMSHSAPYYTESPEDAVALVKSWVQDDNIDIISPQLYSSGHESGPILDETFTCHTAGCTWLQFVGMKPKFMPSIVDASHFEATNNFFRQAVPVDGYFIRAQQIPEDTTQQPLEQE